MGSRTGAARGVVGFWVVVLFVVTASAWSSPARAQTPPPPAQGAAYPPPSGPGYPPPQSAPYPPPPPGGYPPPPGGYPYPPQSGGSYPPGSAPGYGPPPYRPAYYPPPDPPATATHLGIGYKIGNGLGFVGGDIIVSPVPHLALDLQANTFSVSTSSGKANGYGLAPGLQAYLREPGVSTPYLAAGYLYAAVTFNEVHASLHGFFVNAGWEWKWTSGFSILLGGGASYFASVQATDGVNTIRESGGVHVNIEFGLRFMFL